MPTQGFYQTQEQRMTQMLAPQLRQSLELLQVSVLELRSLIRQEMEKNPTLEEKTPDTPQIEVEPGSSEPKDDKPLDASEDFEVLARLDDEWREYFNQNQSFRAPSSDDEARRQFLFDSFSQPTTLQDHLLNQWTLSGFSGEEQKAGELIIGSLNEDGYLVSPLEELAAPSGLDAGRLRTALARVQELDPIGVGARDLKECLQLQLRRFGKEESLAARIVNGHLDDLGAKKFPQIARELGTTTEEVQNAARFISTLAPRPGRLFSAETPAYILPEVLIQKVGEEYVVVLARDQIPRLHISREYRQLMENGTTSDEVKIYIRDKVRSGAFLIKSIHQRQQTIYSIACEIVRVQRDFLEHGLSHLRPLTMSQVAAVLGIHETTVSRAVANKYAQTPRGVFELKYFFTPGYKTTGGPDVSNKRIKEVLAQIVAREDAANPLSDQSIVEALAEQGIRVARRTIAKYREELKIPPSHLRKPFRD